MASPREYVNDPRFTRIFDLPPDATRGRSKPFRIAYADYGYRNEALPEQDNVLLFFGSLMGSRLIHIAKDELAKVHKVRVINPDRPGIGGTDAADAEHRMGLWLGKLVQCGEEPYRSAEDPALRWFVLWLMLNSK